MKNKSLQCAVVNIATLVIVSVLLIAAYGKGFYPAELLKGWDRSISVLEVVFVGFLLYFRMRAQTWICAAVLFASWGGYALFWYQLSLPCNCMGELLKIPTGLSLFLDILFFVLALLLVHWLSRSKKKVFLTVAWSVFGSCVGFLLASGIYHYAVKA